MFLMAGTVFSASHHEGYPTSGKRAYSLWDSHDWYKKMTDDGFYLHIGLISPSKLCYMPLIVEENNSSDKYGAGPHLEIGNMFTITDFKNKHALGLRITWLNASLSTYSVDNYKSSYLQGSVLRLGPYFTFLLDDEMALDLFYQIGPSYAWDYEMDTTMLGNWNTGYFGMTHNIGAGFRYTRYSAGFDMNFGNVKFTNKDELDQLSKFMEKEDINEMYKIRTTCFRIFLGFRF
jgi:hypothetical protein